MHTHESTEARSFSQTPTREHRSTRSHTHVCAHTHESTEALSHTHAHTRAQKFSHTHTCTHDSTEARSLTHTHTPTHSLSLSLSLSLVRAQKLSLYHTHTHTHTCTLPTSSQDQLRTDAWARGGWTGSVRWLPGAGSQVQTRDLSVLTPLFRVSRASGPQVVPLGTGACVHSGVFKALPALCPSLTAYLLPSPPAAWLLFTVEPGRCFSGPLPGRPRLWSRPVCLSALLSP